MVVPAGKSALGKLAQAMMYRARLLVIEGNFGPALTTVRQPLQDMARAAVRMLVEALSTDDVIQPHIIMPTSLVVRNSTQQLEG